MELLDFAKQIERQGEAHYTALAQKSTVPELAGLFRFLAGEERRHYALFDSWAQGGGAQELGAGLQIGEVRAVFDRLTEHFKKAGVPAIDRDELFDQALGLEHRSVRLYQEALVTLSQPAQVELLERVIEQERRHVKLLESLMAYMRHPGEWLENAEWYHLDEF
jgi:rubrerythrin